MLGALGRDWKMAAIKNTKREHLRLYLKELVIYVTAVANGDKTILLDSGFTLIGASQEKPMSPINNLEVAIGVSAEATTRVKRISGAKAYMHQYTTSTPTDDTVWISEGSDGPEHTFTRF